MSKFGQTQRAIYGQIHVALTICDNQTEHLISQDPLGNFAVYQ